MTGRGAWPVSGAGGTFKYKSDQPGPYYYLGSGSKVGGINERAVRFAVKAYQRALNRVMHTDLVADGLLGPTTSQAIWDFQTTLDNVAPWGGIGPDTSKALLYPALLASLRNNPHDPKITAPIVCGFVTQESYWDAGAVGYVDDQDLGLAQINGPAHPDWTEAERFQPFDAFYFIIDYLDNALGLLNDVLDDAILSYNLGIGGWSEQYQRLVGVKGWIADNRPDWWTPPGQSQPRDCRGYINTVKYSCS